ncbi:MAG: REJ domain-containing protein [Pseudomonadota bacterium]
MPSYSPPVISRLFVRGVNSTEVSPTVRLVLEAAYSSTDPATTLLWDVVSEGDPGFVLQPGLTTSTRLDLSTVAVRANSLQPGQTYVFSMTATNSLGNFALGTLNVTAGRPPFNGTFAVTPANGTALETSFLLRTTDWEDDPTSYPLAYVFLYALEDGDLTLLEASADGSERYLNDSGAASLRTSLPLGAEAQAYGLELVVRVTDVIGSAASVSREVFVLPPSAEDAVDQVEGGLGTIEDTIRERNWVSAAVLIEASASVLNFAFREGANTTAAAEVRRDLLTRTEALVRSSDRNPATVESQVGEGMQGRGGGGGKRVTFIALPATAAAMFWPLPHLPPFGDSR